MKKIRCIVTMALLLSAFGQKASAQYYYYDDNYYDSPVMFEVGGSLGLMNCFTDIGGKSGLGGRFLKDLNIGNNQFNGGFYLSALYKYAIGLRLEATFGQVKAYDSILKPVAATSQGRYERNLNFRSKITEVALIFEFHPLYIFFNWENRDRDPPRLSPYIAAGIGYFSFNPQGKMGSNYVYLQPLSLEGQGFAEYPNRKPYKLHQMNIPLGFGFKYELSSRVNLRTEVLYRILSTDYLDDISTRYINSNLFQKYLDPVQTQEALALSYNNRTNPGGSTGIYRKTEGGIRGNPNNTDAYFTINFKVGITFGRMPIRQSGPQRF